MQHQWFETFFQGVAVEFWIRAIPPTVTFQEADFLEQALEISPGAKLLDVPCGHGRHAIELARRGYRVTGVDLSPEALESASASNSIIDWRRGDMRDLSSLEFLPAEFDAAYCFGNSFGYLDHLDAAAFLAALARVLKPGRARGHRYRCSRRIDSAHFAPEALASVWRHRRAERSSLRG